MQQRHYTLEEAQAQVPWLEEVFARMASLHDQLQVQHGELTTLMRLRSGNGTSGQHQEIAEGQRTVDSLSDQLRQGVEEINQKGIIVRDVASGLVDFPTLRDGQEVFLCWFKGEARIEFWHGTNEGIGSRKPL